MQSPIEVLEGILLRIHHPIHSDMEPVSVSSEEIIVKISRGDAPDEIEVRIVVMNSECFDALQGRVVFACGKVFAGVDSRSSPLVEDEEGSLLASFILIPGVKYALSMSDCFMQLV